MEVKKQAAQRLRMKVQNTEYIVFERSCQEGTVVLQLAAAGSKIARTSVKVGKSSRLRPPVLLRVRTGEYQMKFSTDHSPSC